MMWSSLVFLLMFQGLLQCSQAAWNPDAGLRQPLGHPERTVTVSSNPGAATANILDGRDNTQWQSNACLPTGFISRADMNPVLNACATPGRCTATVSPSTLVAATDASFYTGSYVSLLNKVAMLNVSLAAPGPVYQVYFRGSWNAGRAQVNLITVSGAVIPVASANSTDNWKDISVKGSWEGIAAVQVVSTDGFTLTEVSLQGARCFEWATVDMKQVYSISMIRARWWSPDSLNTSLLISTDNVTWTLLRNDLVPNALPTQELWYDEQPLQARFITIKHQVKEDANWRKVYMWELAAYPAGGRWGPAPPAVPQTVTYRNLMGVNGIWGWGSQTFSDTAVKAGVGPLLYKDVGYGGRNYQSMSWDVKKPGNDPKFDTMNKTGTDGQWWLDWNREYRGWQQAGMWVDVSYQFTAKTQPPSSWPDAYATSYTLGYKFGRAFGKTSGAGTVTSFEAGNEPWDYNATFYTQLLRGFTEGIYAGDPTIKCLPCALQAHDPLAETATGGHYIGARLPEDLAPKIDALNLHIYSFYNNDKGHRLGVHPEHPGSSMNGLHNMLAWRDANMPGVPVWVTEWGWDAVRPGESAGATEAVSQLAQAAYGIRGLSLLARKGVAQSHWYFYADDDKCDTLFCRSGLRDTASRSFAELPVYRAFKAFLQVAGNTTFYAAPVEDASRQLHVHVLKATGAADPTHVLVWRSVPVGEVEAAEDSVPMQFNVGFSTPSNAAAAAWKLSGAVPDGRVAVQLPAISGPDWSMPVSSIPTLVVLA